MVMAPRPRTILCRAQRAQAGEAIEPGGRTTDDPARRKHVQKQIDLLRTQVAPVSAFKAGRGFLSRHDETHRSGYGSDYAAAARPPRRAQGQATLPPILRIDIPEHHGEVDIKTAWFHRLDSFAVKMGSGFLDNPLRGRPMAAG